MIKPALVKTKTRSQTEVKDRLIFMVIWKQYNCCMLVFFCHISTVSSLKAALAVVTPLIHIFGLTPSHTHFN